METGETPATSVQLESDKFAFVCRMYPGSVQLKTSVFSEASNCSSGSFGVPDEVQVTAMVATALFPFVSQAVTVMRLAPGCKTMFLADQLEVPIAVPLPPRSLD